MFDAVPGIRTPNRAHTGPESSLSTTQEVPRKRAKPCTHKKISRGLREDINRGSSWRYFPEENRRQSIHPSQRQQQQQNLVLQFLSADCDRLSSRTKSVKTSVFFSSSFVHFLLFCLYCLLSVLA